MENLTVESLVEAGYFSRIDLYFSQLCAGVCHDSADGRVLALVAASVSQALHEGHACVPLAALAEAPLFNRDEEQLGVFPTASAIRKALAASPAVYRAADESGILSHPLVLDQEDRIYTARYFVHERQLAKRLGLLLSPPPRDLEKETEKSWVTERLDHYFPFQEASEPDLQRVAAEAALSHRFCVISGGPGTGKTSTVVKLLALLFERANELGEPLPVVELMAPTGKAATRMMEAIESAVDTMGLSPEIRAALTVKPSTVHRALGVLPHNANRFRRGSEHPLRADLVLVDEASMVDLGMMRHLVDSLAHNARLILLGDRHQLASVEAGSVLAELCSALGGEDLGASASLVELRKSFRFSEDSGIARLAAAVREGRAADAVRLLGEGGNDLCYGGELDAQPERLRKLVLTFYGSALRQTDPLSVLSKMTLFRILCAHRRGASGVDSVNADVTHWLRDAGLVPGGDEFYRGRLILILRNDYELGLRNGDVGLIWPSGRDGFVAHFLARDVAGNECTRVVPTAQLPAHESAFAMTIHKSQGSEHDEVVVLLPDENSRLLTRELVYTGVTRARNRAHIFGKSNALLSAASRSVVRHSGLGSSLRAILDSPV